MINVWWTDTTIHSFIDSSIVIIESERVKAAFNHKGYKRESETENAVREVENLIRFSLICLTRKPCPN